MKIQKKTCNCCGNQYKALRAIAVENMSNCFICTDCNLQLIKDSEINYSDYRLVVVGIKGDFKRILLCEQDKQLNWYDRATAGRLNAEMDNQPLSDIFW